MKKALFTMAILVMAFANVGLAQSVAKLKNHELKTVVRHYGLRGEGDLPETAIWTTVDGYQQKRIYMYDEYDYYLTEVLEQNLLDGNWVNREQVTYEYDFDGRVLECYDYAWNGDDWEAIAWASYSYEEDKMEIVYQYWDEGAWVNLLKEVYNYNDNVTTVLIWIWNGNNWSSDELHTYTFGDTSIEVLMQYMQGGAWQNEEKDTYTLDFDGHVEEILVQGWVGTNWVNDTRTTYNLEGGVFASKFIADWNGSGWDNAYMFRYIYEDGNATRGECYQMSGGEWCPADEEIEMAYGYSTNSVYFDGKEVDMVYVDVTGLKEDSQIACIKVYPVPAENEIFIQAEDFQKAEIYSVTGQKLMESQLENMNVGTLPSGVYLLKVYDRSGNAATQKLMVK